MEQKQKAILAGVDLNNQPDFANSMEELFHLAEACNIEVAGQITQNMNRRNTAHYIGKGKLEEVSALLEDRWRDGDFQ